MKIKFGLFNRISSISTKDFSLWNILPSVFAGASISYKYYVHAGITLESFAERTIGIAVLNGIDAVQRTGIYLKLIVLFSFVMITVLLCMILLEKIFITGTGDIQFDQEKETVYIISLSGLVVLLLGIIKRNDLYFDLVTLHFYMLAVIFFIACAKMTLLKKIKIGSGMLPGYNLLLFSMILPLSMLFLYWVVINGSFNFKWIHYIYLSLCLILFWLMYFIIHGKLRNRYPGFESIDNALLVSVIPLALIPVSIPLSNELQFTLSNVFTVTARNLSLIIIVLLALSGIVMLFIYLKNKRFNDCFSARVDTVSENFLFPLIIISVLLYFHHSHFLTHGMFDMHHDGEDLMPIQQLFTFGSIPFVDIIPTHGLSTLAGQLLFSLVNGYRMIEPWLWNWIFYIANACLMYFILKRMAPPLWAFLMVLFSPVISIFEKTFVTERSLRIVEIYYQYSFFVIPAFSMIWLFKNIKISRFVIHWMICAFFIMWRLEFGLAALLSSIIVISLHVVNHRGDRSFQPVSVIMQCAGSFLAVFGVLLLSYFAVIAVSGESVTQVMRLNYSFLRFPAPNVAYATLIKEYNGIAVWQYLFLPMVSIFYIVYFIIKYLVCREKPGSNHLLLVYIAIFSLVISVKMTQRHCLLEMYHPFLFMFLAAAIPFYIDKTSRNISILIFTSVMLLHALFYQNYHLEIKRDYWFSFHDWKPKESRLNINKSQFNAFTNFINDNLESDQTFFDFSNSSMLYVASGRRHIPYILPNIRQTSESIQNPTVYKLENALQNGLLKFIVFKQGTLWDNVDGVPNEIRSYRIAEFIYKNFKPLGYVGKYQIWIDKSSDMKSPQQESDNDIRLKTAARYSFRKIVEIHQNFNLMDLPYIWGTYDPMKSVFRNAVQCDFKVNDRILLPGERLVITVNKDIDKSRGNYLHIKARSKQNGMLKIRYGKEFANSIELNIKESGPAFFNYMVRISSQWAWSNNPVDKFEITSVQEVLLNEIQIMKGD